jgi:hypothetical protein
MVALEAQLISLQICNCAERFQSWLGCLMN